MSPRAGLASMAVAAALGVAGCQTPGDPDLRLAVLADASPTTLKTLDRVLFDATKEGRGLRGPGDPTKDPLVAVLPPPPGPYEGNSTALPVYFEIVTDGKACFLRERKSGAVHPLPGVACRPK